MWLGSDRAGGAASLEQADDKGSANAKDSSDPADRAIVMIYRCQDPFAKV
jgi:hypothetical protein